MSDRPVYEHIEAAYAGWVADGENEPGGIKLYIYIVNWLGLDPDVPLDVFRQQLAAGEKAVPWEGGW